MYIKKQKYNCSGQAGSLADETAGTWFRREKARAAKPIFSHSSAGWTVTIFMGLRLAAAKGRNS